MFKTHYGCKFLTLFFFIEKMLSNFFFGEKCLEETVDFLGPEEELINQYRFSKPPKYKSN